MPGCNKPGIFAVKAVYCNHMRHTKNHASENDSNNQPSRAVPEGQQPGYAYTPDEGLHHFSSDESGNAPSKKRWGRGKKILFGFLAVFLLVGGFVGWKLLANEVKVFGWKGIWSLVRPGKLKGESRGYVNILVAGNSADSPGHGGANLTDSIILLSVNTQDNTAFMMSVPRDLYVDIPGFDYAKINEAYQDGEQSNFSESGYAPGGMGLLAKVVSENFDVPIDYYALVDYAAVKDAVNAVGGITVTIASNDERGLYDPSPDLANDHKPLVNLNNGQQTLDGTAALGLARARGSTYGSYGYRNSDFTRTENQRLIILGLKDKVTSLGTLANPFKLAGLADSVGNNVKTDMTLGQVRRLYQLTKKIPSDKIVSIGLNNIDGQNLLASYQTRLGQSALIPAKGLDDYSDIKAYLKTLLPAAPAAASDTSGN
jgi:polyisoprenyl-teichoic acid--peptidoglycan teichoic acid transferase